MFWLPRVVRNLKPTQFYPLDYATTMLAVRQLSLGCLVETLYKLWDSFPFLV
jgi:hypothetical protein